MSERQHSELCGCDECEAHDEHERSLPDSVFKAANDVLPVRDNEHHIDAVLAEADAKADYDDNFPDEIPVLFGSDLGDDNAYTEQDDYGFSLAEADAEADMSRWD